MKEDYEKPNIETEDFSLEMMKAACTEPISKFKTTGWTYPPGVCPGGACENPSYNSS